MDDFGGLSLPTLKTLRAALDAAIVTRESAPEAAPPAFDDDGPPTPTPSDTRKAGITLISRAFPQWQRARAALGYDYRTRDGERVLLRCRCIPAGAAYQTFTTISDFERRPFDQMLAIIFDGHYALQRALIIPRPVLQAVGEPDEEADGLSIFVDTDWDSIAGVEDLTATLALHSAIPQSDRPSAQFANLG